MSKFSIFGKQEIDREIDPDKDLSVACLNMRVRKVEIDKADDSKHYKLENLGEVIIKQDGEVFKGAKDLYKAKLRSRMWALYNDLGATEDFEVWRRHFKDIILIKLDEIYETYIKN